MSDSLSQMIDAYMYDRVVELKAEAERLAVAGDALAAVLGEMAPRYCELFEAAGLGPPSASVLAVPTTEALATWRAARKENDDAE